MRAPFVARSLSWLLPAILLCACVPSANPLLEQAYNGPAVAGFWLGLWHGAIGWITFIISLFDSSVSVYEVSNSGWRYNLGFLLGAGLFHGGGSITASRRRRPGMRLIG